MKEKISTLELLKIEKIGDLTLVSNNSDFNIFIGQMPKKNYEYITEFFIEPKSSFLTEFINIENMFLTFSKTTI